MNNKYLIEKLSKLSKADLFRQKYLNEWKPRWPYRVYVIAGSYHIAKSWAMENEVPKDLFHYVDEARDIEGASGQVVYLWEWWNLHDIEGIIECVNYLVEKKQLEVIDGGEKWGASPPK